MKKTKYEVPELNDLSSVNAFGATCATTGNSATGATCLPGVTEGACQAGSSASPGCTTGTTAGVACKEGNAGASCVNGVAAQ